MSLKQLSKEELRQTSFIELAHEILVEKKQAMAFEEIVSEIKGLLEISDKEVKSRLLQFYTDLNIDGRYIAMGDNRWGLREWYPVDQIEEETVPTMKSSKKKKAKKKDEDLDLDDFDDLDDEDLDYDDLDDADDDDDLTDDDDDVDVDDADEDLDLDDDEEELEIDEFDDVDDEDEDEEDELEEEEEK